MIEEYQISDVRNNFIIRNSLRKIEMKSEKY